MKLSELIIVLESFRTKLDSDPDVEISIVYPHDDGDGSDSALADMVDYSDGVVTINGVQ